ncbi:MAG: hypothetical protein K2G52_05215 [Muribaculaceae bacterium]|nr:hypothetical protein [Muribaculaceae bacterium]
MSRPKLKKYLNTLPQEHLVQIILDLYDARKDAREYLEFFMNPDPQAALEKSKKEIYRNYFTPQGRPRAKMSVKAGNDIIADFVSLDTPPELVSDLMIYHVEVLLSRLVLRGIVRETAWTSALNVFRKGIEYICAHSMRPILERRIEKIIDYTCHAPSYLHMNERMNDILNEFNYYESE